MNPQPLQRGAWLLAGVIAGVSFVAQALKFRAGDVPLAQLVSVGSAIFHGSHALQCLVLLGLLLACLLAWPHEQAALNHLAVAGACLLLQVALLPGFDARVRLLALGQQPEPAAWRHGVYLALELLKLFALVRMPQGQLSYTAGLRTAEKLEGEIR